MSWMEAFLRASNNLQTLNAAKGLQQKHADQNEQREMENFQKALDAGDPEAMNNYGLYLYDSGNHELGLEYLTKASIKGQANALASFLWFNLKVGNHEDCVTLYKACRVKLNSGDTPYQLANVDSNFWLNRLALGGNEADAEKSWLINSVKVDHVESLFFPVYLAHKNKDVAKRDKLAQKLNSKHWSEIKDEMLEEQMTSKGWFKKWCAGAYQAIEDMGH